MSETHPTSTVYYCDQCGTRYAGPGLCENGHPAAEVVKVGAADTAAADQAAADAAAATATATLADPNATKNEQAAAVATATEAAAAAAPSLTEPTSTTAAPPLPAAQLADATPTVAVAVQAGTLIATARKTIDDLAQLLANAGVDTGTAPASVHVDHFPIVGPADAGVAPAAAPAHFPVAG